MYYLYGIPNSVEEGFVMCYQRIITNHIITYKKVAVKK